MHDRELMEKEQEAIRQMREMNRRSQMNSSGGKMPPSPDFVRLRNNNNSTANKPPVIEEEIRKKQINNENTPQNSGEKAAGFNGFGLPFLDSILKDKDSTLIIGLLLLLMSEKSDKILLFALVYILL